MTKPCYKGTKKLKMICDSPIVHLFNESDNPDPEYKTEGAAGFDLAASEDIWIYPDCVTHWIAYDYSTRMGGSGQTEKFTKSEKSDHS